MARVIFKPEMWQNTSEWPKVNVEAQNLNEEFERQSLALPYDERWLSNCNI